MTVDLHLKETIRLALAQMLEAAPDPMELLHNAEAELLAMVAHGGREATLEAILQLIREVVGEVRETIRPG